MHPLMSTKMAALFLCLLTLACSAENIPVQLPVHIKQIADGQSVLIRLDKGVVTVVGGEDGQVRVGGQTPFPDQTEYSVTTVNEEIQIITSYTGRRSSGAQVHIVIGVPDNIALAIETDSASISIGNYTGELAAASISGDILVDDVHGDIILRSNRGDVTVQDSMGRISLVGNYGMLALKNVRGNIGVSTIMGTVTLSGLMQAGDDIHLETDHGPVFANLSSSSALTLQVRSTTGDLTCMAPDIRSTTRTCDGEVASGGGSLSIRTVSGPVTLQLLP